MEVKDWDFPGLTTEASRQAQNYQDAMKADGAFVVIPSLKRSLPSKGVVILDGLVPALQAELETTKTRSNPPEATKVDKLVFAAMPFAPQYEDVFFIAMRYAAEQVGAVCTRVDRREFQGSVVDEIQRLIRKSVAVFVDLSEAKPNVLYETGYATRAEETMHPHLLNTHGQTSVRRIAMENYQIQSGPNSQTLARSWPNGLRKR